MFTEYIFQAKNSLIPILVTLYYSLNKYCNVSPLADWDTVTLYYSDHLKATPGFLARNKIII